MRLPMLCLLLAAGLFTACKDHTAATAARTTPDAANIPPHPPQTDLNKAQTDELLNLLSAYYSLKDAFVATDGLKADQAASKVLSAAELLNNEVGAAPQSTEMQPQLKTVMKSCDSIIAVKGDGVEQKRGYFAHISDAMYQVIKAANLKHGGVYQQYCPMAFDNKGAYWLSAEEEIKNPYFGKKMLECGEVKDSF